MHGDQQVVLYKDVDFLTEHTFVAFVVIRNVQNDEEVLIVLIHFGALGFGKTVLNVEFVEAVRFTQTRQSRGIWFTKVEPSQVTQMKLMNGSW